MKKMIIISESTNYKPCLDGRDVKTETEIIDSIANASLAGDREAVVDFAKILVNLAARNDRARTNEGYIQKISQYIVANTAQGDVLCEAEVLDGIYKDKVIKTNSEDTALVNLTRAALLRLTEAKKLKKTYARVIAQGEKPYEAKRRTIYIVL